MRVAVADLLEELEDVDRAHEQVVEVHRVHAVQLALVVLVDVGDRLLEVGADELAVVVGGAQLVLGVGDLGLHRARGEALGVDVELVEAVLDQPARVGRVVDRELARVAEPVGVGAQHPRAGGVEGHHPHRAGGAADEQLDALAHLLRGLVGEGDRQDLVRARLPVRSRYAIRWVSTRVLPEPAPARISSGPSPWVTASRWGSLRPSRSCVACGAPRASRPRYRPRRPATMRRGGPHRRHPRARAAARRRRGARHVRVVEAAIEAYARDAAGRVAARARPRRRRRPTSAAPPSAHAQRDQLRLGLVPDAAQAARAVGLPHGRGRPARPRAVDGGRAGARSSAAEVAAALGQDPDHELMALFARALRELGDRVRDEHGGSFLALARAARRGGAARRASSRAGRPGTTSRPTSERGPVLQARPDRRRRPRSRRHRARRRPAAPDAVRRQPRPPRPAPRRRARASTPRWSRASTRGELLEHGSPEEVEIRACALHAVELLVAAHRSRPPRPPSTTSSGTAAPARATRRARATARARPPTEA